MTLLARIKRGYLRLMQEQLIFKPHGRFVQDIQTPEFYNLDNTEAKFTYTEDGKSIELWYHPPSEEGAPIYLAFHGNTGNWGDVGRPTYPEEFDRRYRIRLLQAIIDSGAGFCAVSCRGHGNSQRATLSERGMIKDIRAAIRFTQTRTSLTRLIPLGESLGASLALHASLMLQQEFRHTPEAVVMISSFASMAEKTYELHPSLRGIGVEKVLRHPFDNMGMIERLAKETKLYVFHPEQDTVTKPYHSEMLRDHARKHGIETFHHLLKDQGHITWNAKEVLSKIRL